MKYRIKNFFTAPGYRVEAFTFALAITIGVALLLYSWTQPWAYRRTGDGVGLAVFPTIFLTGMAVLGAMCLFSDYFASRHEHIPAIGDVTGMEWKSTVLVALVSLFSPLTIFYIDPLLYVSALCLAILIIGQVKQWYLLAAGGVGLIVFIYVFMIRIADVFFPVTWFF